jgi:hypothetical protein
MSTRQYGLLTDKDVRKLFADMNKRPYCTRCLADRRNFRGWDMKKGEDGERHLGFIIPGFSSVKVVPLDIMIVADSIGGGRKGDFRSERRIRLDETVHYLGDYYLESEIAAFHQYEMRKFLYWLEGDLHKNWVFTDLVKCFVYHGPGEAKGKSGKHNMEMAINHCSQYLDRQIYELNPRVILILGKRVASAYCNLRGSQLRQVKHGARFSYERDGRRHDAIYSIFPSSRTADDWVKQIDIPDDDAWYPVKRAFCDFFSKQTRSRI